MCYTLTTDIKLRMQTQVHSINW